MAGDLTLDSTGVYTGMSCERQGSHAIRDGVWRRVSSCTGLVWGGCLIKSGSEVIWFSFLEYHSHCCRRLDYGGVWGRSEAGRPG